MAFSSPPPAYVPPPTPAPPMQMTQPTTQKPQRKGMAPTVIGQALTPQRDQEGGRTLVGGAPSAVGV